MAGSAWLQSCRIFLPVCISNPEGCQPISRDCALAPPRRALSTPRTLKGCHRQTPCLPVEALGRTAPRDREYGHPKGRWRSEPKKTLWLASRRANALCVSFLPRGGKTYLCVQFLIDHSPDKLVAYWTEGSAGYTPSEVPPVVANNNN